MQKPAEFIASKHIAPEQMSVGAFGAWARGEAGFEEQAFPKLSGWLEGSDPRPGNPKEGYEGHQEKADQCTLVLLETAKCA